MNAANLPPASILRPELRTRLQRLEHLERRERQSRYARWHVPAPLEREPEGWLLTYLDLITLLLVMLVAMLAFSQPKAGVADVTAASGAQHLAAKADTPSTPVSLPASAAGSEVASDTVAHAAQASLPVDAPGLLGAQTAPTTSSENAVTATDAPSGPGPTAEPSPAAFTDDAHAAEGARQADRPAPADVALVGSIRSSQSLQTALTFSYHLGDTGISSVPATPDGATGNPMPAMPSSGSAADAPPQPATPPDQLPERSAVPATSPARPTPSLEDLGLNELGENIDVIVNEESVSFRINNEILFTSGQADLMPSGLDVLTGLAQVLARNDYRIAVEGHTDPVPIQNDRFPSNWELSTGRATSVLRHLQSQGIPASRLRATGYADTRPIAPNDSQAGRAFNRRVELIMEMPRSAGTNAQSSSSESAVGAISLPESSGASEPVVRLR